MYRFGLAVALVALLAAGCSDEKAGGLPPITSPSSTAPSPTSASPTATASPRQEVEAAVRRYFAVLAEAGQSGDVSALDPLLGDKCTCREQVNYIKSEAAKGNRITTEYTVDAVRADDVSGSAAVVTATFSAPASAVVDSKGKVVRRLDALKRIGVEMGLRRVGERWVIERVVRLGA